MACRLFVWHYLVRVPVFSARTPVADFGLGGRAGSPGWFMALARLHPAAPGGAGCGLDVVLFCRPSEFAAEAFAQTSFYRFCMGLDDRFVALAAFRVVGSHADFCWQGYFHFCIGTGVRPDRLAI